MRFQLIRKSDTLQVFCEVEGSENVNPIMIKKEETTLEHVITKYLIDKGIKRGTLGFIYLRDAIKIQCLAGENLLKVMELYKSVAEKYNTKWSRAERCIRHSLQSALSEKPVNSEFIRSTADDIRLNYREK